MTISITIIGHNEVDHLNELLHQLQWSDEVIYVDCESSDGSLAKAEELGCKTFSRPNDRNLNVNKSFAMDQASGDWIFYLDPDERIPSELVEEIREIVASETEYSAFRLKRKNHYFGKWLKYVKEEHYCSLHRDVSEVLFHHNSNVTSFPLTLNKFPLNLNN